MGLNQGSDDRECAERMVVRGNLVLRGLSDGSWLRTKPTTTLRHFNLGPWIIGGIIHQNTRRDKSSQKERK